MVQAKSELRRIFTEKLHRMHILFALLFIRCHCSCVLANQNFFEQNELSEGWPVSSPLQININSEVNLVLAPLTQQCMQQIVSLERSCYARYLDAYSELTKTAVTNDYSSVVDGKFCCAFWQWYDCTKEAILGHCQQDDMSMIEQSIRSSRMFDFYCEAYEYGSFHCWVIPLWACVICGLALLMLATIGIATMGWCYPKIFFYVRRRQNLP